MQDTGVLHTTNVCSEERPALQKTAVVLLQFELPRAHRVAPSCAALIRCCPPVGWTAAEA